MSPGEIAGGRAATTPPDHGYTWVALSNTTMAVFMSALDGSIVIISLPAIFRGIHLDPLAAGNIGYLLWMIMGYRLVQAVLVVTLGRLGDMYGRVRIYNAGFAVFALASVLLSFDPFAGGSVAGLIAAAARGGLQFMLIIWLQGIWLPLHGYRYVDTPLWAGIYLLPLTASFLIAGPVSGYLSDRFGARGFATAGMVVFGASFVGLMLLPVDFPFSPRSSASTPSVICWRPPGRWHRPRMRTAGPSPARGSSPISSPARFTTA
jgi:MFS family permease